MRKRMKLRIFAHKVSSNFTHKKKTNKRITKNIVRIIEFIYMKFKLLCTNNLSVSKKKFKEIAQRPTSNNNQSIFMVICIIFPTNYIFEMYCSHLDALKTIRGRATKKKNGKTNRVKKCVVQRHKFI